MLHAFRSAYGWTDDVTLAELKKHGGEWFLDAYHTIMEERIEERRWLLLVAPLSRTPHNKKDAGRLQRYGKKLHRFLDQQLPWKKEERAWAIRQRLRRPPQSRMTIVDD